LAVVHPDAAADVALQVPPDAGAERSVARGPGVLAQAAWFPRRAQRIVQQAEPAAPELCKPGGAQSAERSCAVLASAAQQAQPDELRPEPRAAHSQK